MALSTPRFPVRKVFSQLPGSHHLALYLLSLSGVLSPASLAGRQEEAAVVNVPRPGPTISFDGESLPHEPRGARSVPQREFSLVQGPAEQGSRALHQSGPLCPFVNVNDTANRRV